MLFKRADLDRIVAGEISLAFRRWKRPTVRAGGRLRTAVGELAIEEVEAVTLKDMTLAEARAAGFETLGKLRSALRGGVGQLYRVRLSYAGVDRRIALRARASLTPAEARELRERLERIDARCKDGPWTTRVLQLVARSPEVRAEELAGEIGMQRLVFKQRVRRLKELGLTESLEVGYRLSPCGRALLAELSGS